MHIEIKTAEERNPASRLAGTGTEKGVTITQAYDGTIWAAEESDAARNGNAPGILLVLRVPTFGGVQVDGVCPRCGRWHTVALRNGVPFCVQIDKQPYSRVAAEGGIQ